jgi:hypothetical protein
MQRSAAPPGQTAAPFFSSLFGGGGGTTNRANRDNRDRDKSQPPPSPKSKSHRPTSPGDDHPGGLSPKQQQKDKDKGLLKDRKPSLGRKPSFIFSAATASPDKKKRNRADSGASTTGPPADGAGTTTGPTLAHRPSATRLFIDHTDPAPNPADRMLSRGAVTPISGYPAMTGTGPIAGLGQQSESSVMHQHIQDTANKRISTLDYLRKA